MEIKTIKLPYSNPGFSGESTSLYHIVNQKEYYIIVEAPSICESGCDHWISRWINQEQKALLDFLVEPIEVEGYLVYEINNKCYFLRETA